MLLRASDAGPPRARREAATLRALSPSSSRSSPRNSGERAHRNPRGKKVTGHSLAAPRSDWQRARHKPPRALLALRDGPLRLEERGELAFRPTWVCLAWPHGEARGGRIPGGMQPTKQGSSGSPSSASSRPPGCALADESFELLTYGRTKASEVQSTRTANLVRSREPASRQPKDRTVLGPHASSTPRGELALHVPGIGTRTGASISARRLVRQSRREEGCLRSCSGAPHASTPISRMNSRLLGRCPR